MSREHVQEQLDPMQVRDAILSNVTLNEGMSGQDLTYDPELHGLTVPGDEPDTVRLAFFRAVNKEAEGLVNRPVERANAANAQFGAGLYGGNSVESVAHFAWPGDRTIGLFLTPAISKDGILDVSYADNEKLKELRDLARIKAGTVHRNTGAANQSRLSEQYGQSELVIMGKPLDVRLSQRLQATPFAYPIKPFWYLWLRSLRR